MIGLERPHLVDKPLGATPLQALDLLRVQMPALRDEKLAYAGRLDPMASGLLLVVSGDLLARQEEFWAVDKEYEAVVALGMHTDSYDLLGMVDGNPTGEVPVERMLTVSEGLVGKMYLPVPVFSSNRWQGKPLFAWARGGLPVDAQIPVRRMIVKEINIRNTEAIETPLLASMLKTRIPLVGGDFRQELILGRWAAFLSDKEDVRWPLVRLQIRCAGGTYVRSLVHELGRQLGTGAVLVELRRTSAGSWSVHDPDVVKLSWPR